jgi:hypothetical protein
MILDFGFWILDWRRESHAQRQIRDRVFNPKSKIQNPK